MGDRFELDDGAVDLGRRQVTRHPGPSSELTWLEVRLLRYLLDAGQRPVPREELLQMVWDYSPRTVSRAVDKTVARLRKKLEVDPARPVHLQTAFGEGYRLVPAVPADPVASGPLAAGRDSVQALLAGARCVALAGVAGSGKSWVAAALGEVRDPRADVLALPREGCVVLDPCDGLDDLLRPLVDEAIAQSPALQVVWVARHAPPHLPSVTLRPWSRDEAVAWLLARHPDRDRPWAEGVAQRAAGVPGRLAVAARLPGASGRPLSPEAAGWNDVVAGFVRGAPRAAIPDDVARELVASGHGVAQGERLWAVGPARPGGVTARRRRWAILATAATDPRWAVDERGEAVAAAREALAAEAWAAAIELVCATVDAWSRDGELSAEEALRGVPHDHEHAPRLWVRCRLPALREQFGDALAEQLRAWWSEGPPDVRCLAARRLGGLANGVGDDDEATRWLRRAHDLAPGPHLRIGGALPLAAKVADTDPDEALALLRAARGEAATWGLWPRVAQLGAVHAGVWDDQGRVEEALAAWAGLLGVLDRAGNDRVLHYFAARALLAADAGPERVRAWLDQAEDRGNRHGQAFLGVAWAWAGEGTVEDVMAHEVPFATELAALDAAFADWARGATPEDWLARVPPTSRQGRRAAEALRAARGPRTADALRAHLPAVPSASLWRWLRRLPA